MISRTWRPAQSTDASDGALVPDAAARLAKARAVLAAASSQHESATALVAPVDDTVLASVPVPTFQRSSERRTQAAAAPAHKSRKPELSLKGRALNYLSRREYSRAELRRKLLSYSEDLDEIDRLLDALEREKWLSTDRFAESVVHRRAQRVGVSRIVGELKQHHVDPSTVAVLAEQLRETELTRARAVWQKKFGSVATTPEARARQVRFLAGRGFSHAVIGKIVRGAEVFPEDDL